MTCYTNGMIQYDFNPSKENLLAAATQHDSIDVMMNFRTSPFLLAHTHAYWELVIMKENTAVNILDGAERVINHRDFCLLRPEQIHHIKLYNRSSPQYYNLMIRTEYLYSVIRHINPKLLEKPENLPQYGTLEPALHSEVIRLLDQTFNLSVANITEKQHIFRLVVLKLVAALLTPKTTEIKDSNLTTQIVSIMSNPENMRLSLYEIAEKVGYSQEYIIRTFRKSGLSRPSHVFTGIKFAYARSLLSSTDIRTSEIAEQIGVSDISYFNKTFKRIYGVSPSVYRKNNPLQ